MLTAGKLDRSSGRATSNSTGKAVAEGTKESNDIRVLGGDWKDTKDLTFQYYYARLENYYKQNYFSLDQVLPLAEDQSFKTDLRYFDSRSDVKNGETAYRLNNNAGMEDMETRLEYAGDRLSAVSPSTYEHQSTESMMSFPAYASNGSRCLHRSDSLL